MVIGRIVHHIGIAAAALVLAEASQAWAGEYAVLTDGFRVHAERHEIEGSTVRLFANGGMMEMSATQITGYEQEEYTPPPPVKAALATAAPALPLPANHRELVAVTAKKHGLPAAFVQSVVAAESAFRPDAISPKGAIGLMQLMPGTAKVYGANPRIPEQNVDAGTQYLRELLARYEDKDDQVPRALAAYNAGPGAVDKYNGIPPYRETQDYVRRVLRTYHKLGPAVQQP
ncbi:MAG: lytic transglycosylase domain-containing protein [Acidobacteriota bacterium]|nr:lytic transglycosylase domain-containing protein [Acidobacteriota bacterium]